MGCTRPGLSLVAPRRANMMRTDGGEAGGEKRKRTDRLWIVHMHDFTGFKPEIASRSQRKSVQYEANINHISKNNIPAAPSLCSSPFSLSITAASPVYAP